MKSSIKWIIILVAALIIVWWYATSGVCCRPEGGDDIVIGASLPLTGFAAESGDMAQKAMLLAAEEINAAGGIEGRMVEIVIEDDMTDPTGSVTAFTKLVSVDEVDAAVGGLWDFTNQPIIPIAKEHGVTFISPTDFRIEGHTEFDDHSFGMFSDFEDILRELKGFLEEKNPDKLAVVRFTSNFGEEITRTLNIIMDELGKPEVLDETYAELGTNDYRTTILKLKNEGVDAVFLDMVSQDSFTFMKQARELDYSALIMSHVLLSDGLANESIDNDVLEGGYVLDWTFSSDSFDERFEDRYGIPPARNAENSYDATYILVEAVAASESREEVNDYLESRSFHRPGRLIEFTDTHIVKDTPTRVLVIRDGKVVELE